MSKACVKEVACDKIVPCKSVFYPCFLRPVQTNATCCHNIAQHCWVNVVQCWLRVFKRSQHVGQCCVYSGTAEESGIYIYPKLFAKHSHEAFRCARTSPTMLCEPCKLTQHLVTCFIDHENKRNVGRCWAKSLTGFKLHATCANIMQHCPTWCTNERSMLYLKMLGDVVPTCCVRLHRPLHNFRYSLDRGQ